MIQLIITALAVYGTSKLLVEYDGYMNVFYKLRSVQSLTMLHCVICTACWVALAFAVVFWLGWAMWLLPLAIVGVIILIEGLK